MKTKKNTPNRKQRVDSIGEAINIAKKYFNDIKPPSHMFFDESDIPFWNSIILELPRSEWTDHKLSIAVFLVRSMSGLERSHNEMCIEGSIVEVRNQKGEIIDHKKILDCLLLICTRNTSSPGGVALAYIFVGKEEKLEILPDRDSTPMTSKTI